MSITEEMRESSSSQAGYILDKILRRVHRRTSQREPRMRSLDGRIDFDNIIYDYDVNDDMFERMTFRETLLVSLFDGGAIPTPVGALSLDVQKARGTPFPRHGATVHYHHRQSRVGPMYDEQKRTSSADDVAVVGDPFHHHDYGHKKFLVHVSSQLDVEGDNGGSRITAWVDRSMQTLEEKRVEYIRRITGTEEKSLYVSSQKDCYFVKRDRTEEIFYSIGRAKNLICEGANFVLMRYLALARYVGRFELTTTYINGDLCRNVYECRGPSSGLVNNRKLDVCRIFRTVIEKCGLVHNCMALLTLQGQILKMEWDDCPYLVQLNPLAEVNNETPHGNLRVTLDKKWHHDLQLLSKYLDTKTETKKVIENYMNDNKEAKYLISDYMQAILQLKPEDVLEFTAKYFLSFSPELLPRTEYFEPDEENDANEQDDKVQWRYI